MTGTIVIPRVFGGLGNQLFIYSAARRLSLINNADLAIDHVSGFRRDFKYGRRYMLDKFCIEARKATSKERLEPLPRFRRYLARAANRQRPFSERYYIQQKGIDFDQRLLDYRPQGTVYLEGYWQSESYFSDISETIRNDLRIEPPRDARNEDLVAKMRSSSSVALHVRFFDNSGTTISNNTPEDYYRRAIEKMNAKVPAAEYFVFSDKPAEALARLPLSEDKVTIIDHNMGDDNAHLDLFLMTQCRHVIMANSTFSWWAAWLGEKHNGIVIAPAFEMRQGTMSWGFRGLLPARWEAM